MKKINFSLLVFLCFCARFLINGATYSEAIALFAVSGLYGYSLYLASKAQPDVSKELQADIDHLKSSVDAMKAKLIFKPGSLNNKL